jgi:ethanolamine utilization protein EutA
MRGSKKKESTPSMHDDHDLDQEHDHTDFGPGAVAEDIEGLEMFTLRSVGIDIGSSTSHLVFSRLTLRREGAALSGRFRVTEREILYRSPILLTPYRSATLIDVDRLQSFIQSAYREAGFAPENIDTGAVVITGEALKKENAKPIADIFARDSGKFICASAGPNHEAILAAHGCGAVALSAAERRSILNVDVGGGTCKLSWIRAGEIAQTAAVNLGARLIAFDDSGVLTRIEEPAALLMKELGVKAVLGEKVAPRDRERMAELMAELLVEVITGKRLSALAKALMITEPLEDFAIGKVDHLVFSGGVSEYIYGRDRRAYGDLGPLFARAVRKRLDRIIKGDFLRESTEGIRATVIGAGEYTVQASGNTSYISSTRALPAHGLKVIRPLLEGEDSVAEAVKKALAKFDLPAFTTGLALAISIKRPPDYPALRKLAESIAAVLTDGADADAPLFIVLDLDVAKSLGGILKEELGVRRDIVAVDGIDVGDLDYLDIGRPMGVSEVLPVTVKSLMFPSKAAPKG